MALNVETFENPRSNLPNTYTDVQVREIDFVSRFADSWQALREILGIMKPIKKENGTTLTTYKASVTLTDGDVDAGCLIPYSKTALVASRQESIKIRKYAKATTIEEVEQYGAQNAIERTDNAFFNALQNVVVGDLYDFMLEDESAIEATYPTFQKAVAMSIGLVKNKFQTMDKEVTDVAVFVNTLDAYDYIGGADITVQSAFGLDYIKNFLGAKTMFLSSKIPQGKVIATPVENMIPYYVDPASSDFAKMGLTYTIDRGETPFIGIHVNGNYGTAVGEVFAIMGVKVIAEYDDGIAIVTIDENP